MRPRRQLAGLVRLACAVLAAGLVSGCTGSTAGDLAADAQLRHRLVECLHVIDVVPEPGPGYAPHGSGGGFIALPTGTLQLGRSGSEGSGREDYRFAKFGLLVRRAQQASLEIVSAPDDAFFNYGSGAFGPADTLTAGPCDSDRGEWMAWAGGIWVNEPGCVEVIVSSEDEEIPVQLAVGAPCDG